MRKAFIILVFCAISHLALAQPSTKGIKIQQLQELTGGGKLGVQLMTNLLGSLQKRYPSVDKEFWDEFIKEVKPEELTAKIAPIYEKYYTEEDIDQLIAFYKSPVGKKSIELMPQIMQESLTIGQNWGTEIVEKVTKRLKEKGYTKDL